MAATKYGKNILRQTAKNTKKAAAIPVTLEGPKDWCGVKQRMTWTHVSKPVVVQKEAKSHKFDKFLCILGANPNDTLDIGTEIEITMGKEAEKHVVDSSTIVCIPKGTSYGPINVLKVTKPIILCEISMGADK